MNSKLQDVLILWQNDLQFRAEFKINPEDALKKAQLELSPDDLNKIKDLLKRNHSEDDNLDERISK